VPPESAGGAAFLLASGSPRRREILSAAGWRFEVVDPGDDGPSQASSPDARVLDHARFKAATVVARHPGRVVLAADTLVFAAGRVLPKPADRAEAETMLRLLSGRLHEVWTGVVVVDAAGRRHEAADRAEVAFRAIPEPELEAYLAGPEWADKAGAYGIQGTAGAWAQLRSGELETVVGLSARTAGRLLVAAGACPRGGGG
jgi:septum formation protein